MIPGTHRKVARDNWFPNLVSNLNTFAMQHTPSYMSNNTQTTTIIITTNINILNINKKNTIGDKIHKV